MVNYANGKIYQIIPTCEHEEGDVYIGSSAEVNLCNRMSKHRYNYRHRGVVYTACKLFEKYGEDNLKIELIEAFPCQSKTELEAREGFLIRERPCINKRIEGRTKVQWYADNKERREKQQKANYEKNKAKRLEQCKIYVQKHKEKTDEYQKQYREQNKEQLSEHHKAYYAANREDINARRKERYEANKETINAKRRQKTQPLSSP
jgi:hypothetical protein